jgi:hypothetical protein
MSPGIDSKESVPPAYVASAGIVKQSIGVRNQVGIRLSYRPIRLHSLADFVLLESILELPKSLQIRILAGRYDNPLPTRFLAPIDCSKIPAQCTLQSLELIKGLELMQGLIILLLPLTITGKQYLVETKNSLESLSPVLRSFLLLC